MCLCDPLPALLCGSQRSLFSSPPSALSYRNTSATLRLGMPQNTANRRGWWPMAATDCRDWELIGKRWGSVWVEAVPSDGNCHQPPSMAIRRSRTCAGFPRGIFPTLNRSRRPDPALRATDRGAMWRVDEMAAALGADVRDEVRCGHTQSSFLPLGGNAYLDDVPTIGGGCSHQNAVMWER